MTTQNWRMKALPKTFSSMSQDGSDDGWLTENKTKPWLGHHVTFILFYSCIPLRSIFKRGEGAESVLRFAIHGAKTDSRVHQPKASFQKSPSLRISECLTFRP